MNGLFVTGTDTGVGKTFVTATLARRLRGRGKSVFAFKPIETGCELRDGRLVGADQDVIVEAAGGWQTGSLTGIYRLRSPVAPLVAAEAEGTLLDLDLMVATTLEGAALADVTLVEGAGGWRVPLTPSADIAVLAQALGVPVVVVSRATLGTINHTLLTVEAVVRDRCRIAAVVLSLRPGESRAFAESNAEQVSRRWSGPVLVLQEDADLDPIIDRFT